MTAAYRLPTPSQSTGGPCSLVHYTWLSPVALVLMTGLVYGTDLEGAFAFPTRSVQRGVSSGTLISR